MSACRSRRHKPPGKIVERLDRDPRELDIPGLRPARQLPPRTVKLTVAGQHTKRTAALPRACRSEPDQEVMGIGRKDDGGRIAATQFRGDMGLGFGPDLVHHLVHLWSACAAASSQHWS